MIINPTFFSSLPNASHWKSWSWDSCCTARSLSIHFNHPSIHPVPAIYPPPTNRSTPTFFLFLYHSHVCRYVCTYATHLLFICIHACSPSINCPEENDERREKSLHFPFFFLLCYSFLINTIFLT